MLTVGLLGAGAIGRIHAGHLTSNPRTRLKHIVDTDARSARTLAEAHGAEVVDIADVLGDPEVDAVVIATPGTTHSDFIEMAARAGKHIFCEKPLGVDVARARQSLEVVEQAGVRLTIGFHRRFDPSFHAAQERIAAGEIGALQVLGIVSRTPRVPTAEYCAAFGGMFLDSFIHDFDMARWLLADEPVEVFAMGSCLVDPAIGAVGEVDSVVMTLRSASGRLCQITGSYGCVYGYDQRIEAYGSEGMIRVGNVRPTSVEIAGRDGFRTDRPLAFFPERYPEAYRLVLDNFIDGIRSGDDRTAKGIDGLRALILADAARESAKRGLPVRLDQP